MSNGPLHGLRILELAGLGPLPFAAMVLSDLGADIIRIDRRADAERPDAPADVLGRNRRSLALDLKDPADRAELLVLVEHADALIEGFRPGVTERLGVGPQECLARNPRLVYGRMTGWGQDGPYVARAGHDVNYIAVTGALAAIGRAGQPPSIPLALLGDFGGGGLMLALGVVSAVVEARNSGVGQVVDAAVVDGVALMMSYFTSRYSQGALHLERGTNIADSGSHFYDVYECADGRYVSIGAVEPGFYRELMAVLDVAELSAIDQRDPTNWPAAKQLVADAIRKKSQADWIAAFGERDACFAPVLTMADAPQDPHLAARGTFVDIDGLIQGAPAPRFSRTPGSVRRPPPRPGHGGRAAADEWLDNRRES